MRVVQAALSLGLVVTLMTTATVVMAEGTEHDQIAEAVKSSSQSLAEGQHRQALRTLEGLADQGLRHPELSFNRALSYWARAQSPAPTTGDLGQAAAGFAETLALRPDDAQARQGLEEVQLSVSRKKAKGDGAAVNESLGLLEKALLSLNALALFGVALLGSILACVGVVLRLSRSESRRVTGAIVLGLGLFFLLPCTLLAQLRSQLFADSQVAVVISPQAKLLDQSGRPRPGTSPLLESALVHVGPSEHGLVPLVGFASESWLRVGQLRFVGRSSGSEKER